ncbi:CDP-alcohol phosphatidyltransferase family protein [Marinobacter sp. 1_MG-2023]|uniref:CDP-alcohol phosphatidyltransferase family protein n=1 Tax=Marinobacter sp. 1_MG-2023 TaxID=3062627 RepID=UPI0026E3B079|nr:CDP-alcohol phosphatidyltransferase family protein [Marinobacter sp. 1_MG-2023]MDO6824616.1 CDP-alcohol phosphatidyltransferase family protein [Marinobacter sp. 1_MG-2023]
MDSERQLKHSIIPPWMDLLWGAALAMLWLLVATQLYSSSWLMITFATLLYGSICTAVLARWPSDVDFGWANRATLFRSSLIIVLVAASPFIPMKASEFALWLYAIGALLALVLDGVDGKLARATNSGSDFGARFDMEVDALLILGLCIAVIMSGKAGAWVLALGLMRYLFVAAASLLTWLNNPLPDSFRRKTICVWQIVTLMVAILPPISSTFASLTLATALLLLAWSFTTDVYWLYQRRLHHETA